MKLEKTEQRTFLISNWLELSRVLGEERKTLEPFLRRSMLATVDGGHVIFAPEQFLAVCYCRIFRSALGIRGSDPTSIAQTILVTLSREPDADIWLYLTRALESTRRHGKQVKRNFIRVRLAAQKDQIHLNPQEKLIWTRSVQSDYQKLLDEIAEVFDRGIRDQYRPKEKRLVEKRMTSAVRELRAAVAG